MGIGKLPAVKISFGAGLKLGYSKGRLKNFQVFPYLLTIFISQAV